MTCTPSYSEIRKEARESEREEEKRKRAKETLAIVTYCHESDQCEFLSENTVGLLVQQDTPAFLMT